MEESLESKIRRWTTAIAAEELAQVITELEEFLSGRFAKPTVNKILFKLLQHLSHAACKSSRSNLSFGRDLSSMTKFLCGEMTEVSSGKKFFSSVYYIVSCLLEMKFYVEAIAVCNYLLPEWKLCREDETITRSEIFEPTLALWHRTASNLFCDSDFSNPRDYESFRLIVDYELNLTKFAFDDSSPEIAAKLLSYARKVSSKSDWLYRENFRAAIFGWLEKEEITLGEENSEATWQSICELIPLLIGKEINSRNVSRLRKETEKLSRLLAPRIRDDTIYTKLFKAWSCFCKDWFRPPAEKPGGSEVGIEYLSILPNISDPEYSCPEVIRPYLHLISHFLSLTMSYWSESVKNKEKGSGITSEMIELVLRITKKHLSLSEKCAPPNCQCGSPDCGLRIAFNIDLVMPIKCLTLIARFPASLKLESVRKHGECMMRRCLFIGESLKRGSCKKAELLVASWATGIYNVAVSCENYYPAGSIVFYEELLKNIMKVEGGPGARKSVWGFEEPVGTILHRLSSVCVKLKNYEKARNAAAANCLFHCNISSTKAYSDWTTINYKDPGTGYTSIVRYLRSNDFLAPEISLDDYDLGEVCLREIKALRESRLPFTGAIPMIIDELETLSPKPLSYAMAVQLLAHHSLNFEEDSSLKKYLRRASLLFEREKSACLDFLCLYAMMKFYEFFDRVREVSRKTCLEMENTLFALTAQNKKSETAEENEKRLLVPAYSAINMTITSDLESCLNQAFLRWRRISDSDLRAIKEASVLRHSLETIKIAGEYARLYNFEILETEAWSILYKIGNRIGDGVSVIYATSRSLTSSSFDPRWIETADKLSEKLEDSEDRGASDIVARYRLCLANFYYETGETKKADCAYDRATAFKEIKFMQNFSKFLLLRDVDMKYRLGRNRSDDQSSYANIVIESLYTILSIDKLADETIYGQKDKQLRDYEALLDSTNKLALRMNSLLSHREISAHLTKRLSTAQKLVSNLRVAECLKNLCYIDLSRAELDDCEVKLQGLEHILEIEAFDVTMRSKLSPCRDWEKELSAKSTPAPSSPRQVDALRDIGQSDASPVLRKKVFAKPDFLLHGERCSCFKCTNASYQYLVFSCTHIRAQIFALQKNSTPALQHFLGAMKIRKCILEKQEKLRTARIDHQALFYQPQQPFRVVEYVLFQLDYCRFRDWALPADPDSNETLKIAFDALELCDYYNLHHHPVWVTVNEYIFQKRFENVFDENDFSRFMVPEINEMEENAEDSVQHSGICVTPVRENIEKRPISVRRRKTPPFLKLDRVPSDLDDEEGNTIANFQSTSRRRLRRKIYDDEYYSEDEKSGKNIVPEIKVSAPKIEIEKIDDSSAKLSKIPRRKNCQPEAKTRVKSRIKKSATNESGEKSGAKCIEKMTEVAELFNEMSVGTDGIDDSRISGLSNGLENLSVNSLPEVAEAIEEESSSNGRRASARLRSKTRDRLSSSDSQKGKK